MMREWPRGPDGRRQRSPEPRGAGSLRFAQAIARHMRLTLVAAIVVPTLFISSPIYAEYAQRLPDVTQIAAAEMSDTIVYASDGATVLADLHPPGYQHYYEPLSAMGTLLPAAIIAIEDRNFYSEPGVDLMAVARAALVNYKAHSTVEGASTITEQLIKLRLIGDQPTLDRKLREALAALELEQHYTKPQILEMYLNSVFFGNGAWGTAAAAKIYFHQKTSGLDLAQAAMLAGLVRGPTYYDPLLDWPRAKARQHEVLNAMVRAGAVTAKQSADALKEDLSPPRHLFKPINQIAAPGFVSYVTSQLVATYGADMTYGGGLKVVTTLNRKLQSIAQNAITSSVRSLAYRRVTQGAMVAIDPSTGAIIAMVGSASPKSPGGQYNLAVWPPRNPGSSMKIYTYTAAIASGRYTMTSLISDSPLRYVAAGSTEVYTPQNYDGSFHGTMQIQQALGNSLNVPAVKVELGVGVGKVVAEARAMGAPPWQQHTSRAGAVTYTSKDPLNSFGPSLTLGGYGETPLQMATGASVLAAKGVLHQPFAIFRVTQGSKVVFAHKVTSKQVIDPRVAFIMGQMLSNDRNRYRIFGPNTLMNIPGRHVAVKTGTSDSFADAWTIGYTPNLVAAVWVGNADWRMKMTPGSDSFYTAVPTWHSFMAPALKALGGGDRWYTAPHGLVTRVVNGQQAWYLPGTAPR